MWEGGHKAAEEVHSFVRWKIYWGKIGRDEGRKGGDGAGDQHVEPG